MKKVYLSRIVLVSIFAFFIHAVAMAQNVGVNTDNPTNSLHVKAQLPTNDPVRFETLQPAMVGDTAVLVCDPVSGVVRQLPISTLFNTSEEWVFDPASGYIYARRAKTEGFDIVVTNDGQIGIRNNNPTEALDVNGKTKTTTFQMTNGATNNYVMRSDASGNGSWAPVNSVFTDTDDQQITTFSINPTTNVLTLTLQDGGTQTVNLTPYLDNTDNQQITNFSLNPTTNILTLSLQNGGTQSVNLSTYINTDTDDQTLSISGQNLSISEGNTVVLPDRDQQSLSISGQSLSISGGNTVTLPQSIDHDFYEVGTTSPPDNINDDKFTHGNIGIGTNAPTERLHVQGNQYISGSLQKYILGTSASSWRVTANDGSGNFNNYINSTSGATHTYESDGPAFRTLLQNIGTNNTTNRYRFMYATPGTAGTAITWNEGWTLSPSTGNFGIGTNNPTTRLDVNGKTRTTEFQMTTGATNNYIMKSDASGNGSWVAANTIFTDTDTDDQQITTFSINPTTNVLTLTLQDGGTQTVNLTPYLDNTDNQQITNFSLNPTTNILTLSLQNGGTQSVNLSSYINTDTDDQTLSVTGHNLSISEGNTVVLPDNDEQTLSLSGQNLSISGGNTVTLPQNNDHDWYEVGTTTPPDNINDNIFTMGNVGINTNSPVTRLTVNSDITNDGSFSYSESEVVVFDPTTNGGDTPNGTNDVLTLAREGVATQALGNRASFALGRYEDVTTNSRSQMDIKLQH
ncbi:MAG: hypothetical protein IPN76_32255, partial [Saprospiraceae bacterium]|nr:hypothetical protein [Saprospiraceae bacterium]